MYILAEKNSFSIMNNETNDVIKTWPIKSYESPTSCIGKYEAIELIKELEGLSWLDINSRIRKVK